MAVCARSLSRRSPSKKKKLPRLRRKTEKTISST